MRNARQKPDIAEPRPEKAPSRRSKVQSAGTGMAVLKALAAMGGAASLTALASRLEESPAKVHRYLASLVDAELVRQEETTSRYVLGREAIFIGLAAMRQSDVLSLAPQALARLAESHDVSCFVAILGNHGPTIVRWVEPLQPVTVNVKVGSVMPMLWSATGRAFGAFSDAASLFEETIRSELAEATPERRRLLPDRKAVDALFEEIRLLRCAPVRDVLLNGVSAVAAPIFDANERLCAVMTALGTSGSFDPTPGGSTALVVRQAADSVSARLGYPSRS
jgi:DNA-binding IclR family transcriptional regulator